eukprot:CAMPEP_0198219618 /NCGR_PEP_ID=MMETSP1445-20131203/75324_1 /TAXON_ID=36898 /ORGANISM="Pyramimonas sp., Strain CCMP2087" /LENGTH=218 /DNA_ID=CAMNT_0043897089 /DNA_START=58 /DNA_END=710 /DNA_ORIENTATION=+
MPIKGKNPRLEVHVSSVKHPKSRLPTLIRGHPFNVGLVLLVPTKEGGTKVQGKHALGPEEKLIFKSATLSLGDLLGLSPRWTDQSDWCAYSACTALDRADVVAVTPDASLHLSLSKETYQQMGLQGARSKEDASGERFHVRLNLRGEELKSGSPRYIKLVQLWEQIARPLAFVSVGTFNGVDQPDLGKHAISHRVKYTCTTVEPSALPSLSTQDGAKL